MWYLKIITKFNEIKLIVDNIADEKIQELMNQPYVQSTYIRWIDTNEYQTNPEYCKVKRIKRKKEK